MKKLAIRTLLLCTVALGALALPACKTAPTVAQASAVTVQTETAIQKSIDALPMTFKADVAAAVAKVASPKNLNTVANGIESLAADGAALPAPATLNNGVLGWVDDLPDVGPIWSKVVTAYNVAYPLFKPTANTLTAIGEFIRSLEPTKAAITSAVQQRLHNAAQMAFDCVLPRRR